jgi:hypothetical protein
MISKVTETKSDLQNHKKYTENRYSAIVAYGYGQMVEKNQKKLSNNVFGYESSVNFHFRCKLLIALSPKSVLYMSKLISNKFSSVKSYHNYLIDKQDNFVGKYDAILLGGFVNYHVLNSYVTFFELTISSFINTGFESKLYGHKQYLNTLQLNYLKHFDCVNSWDTGKLNNLLTYTIENINY